MSNVKVLGNIPLKSVLPENYSLHYHNDHIWNGTMKISHKVSKTLGYTPKKTDDIHSFSVFPLPGNNIVGLISIMNSDDRTFVPISTSNLTYEPQEFYSQIAKKNKMEEFYDFYHIPGFLESTLADIARSNPETNLEIFNEMISEFYGTKEKKNKFENIPKKNICCDICCEDYTENNPLAVKVGCCDQNFCMNCYWKMANFEKGKNICFCCRGKINTFNSTVYCHGIDLNYSIATPQYRMLSKMDPKPDLVSTNDNVTQKIKKTFGEGTGDRIVLEEISPIHRTG